LITWSPQQDWRVVTYDPNIENSYPTGDWSEITDFEYEMPMIQRREAGVVPNRGGKEKDAEYIPGDKYRVTFN
jgi:hypothetical protein